MNSYDGIRGRFPWMRWNAFIEMNETYPIAAIASAREKLRAELEHEGNFGFFADEIEPWGVEITPASWGFPDHIVVTW